jgi:uncharacterized protein YndB with AHSA1/START domain
LIASINALLGHISSSNRAPEQHDLTVARPLRVEQCRAAARIARVTINPVDPIELKMDLAAGRDRVWELWTTNDGLSSWLCLRANVEPVVGGAYELFWNPDLEKPESDSTIGCRVLSIDRPRLLHFDWRGSNAVADVMNVPDAEVTEVTVQLFPTPTGTRLELVHAGWGDGPDWERARDWFARAWEGAFERLRAVV